MALLATSFQNCSGGFGTQSFSSNQNLTIEPLTNGQTPAPTSTIGAPPVRLPEGVSKSEAGETLFTPARQVMLGFGLGQVQQVFVKHRTVGQTGTWWCDHHFANNLGGSWSCLEVSGGTTCDQEVSANELVTCQRRESSNSRTNLALFSAPSACEHSTLDSHEHEWCLGTSYFQQRNQDTYYQQNNWLRVGINRSYGGTIFELYGPDGLNRIQEHGGAAMQLSIWGYDTAGVVKWYVKHLSDQVRNYFGYDSKETCLAGNPGRECTFGVEGKNKADGLTQDFCMGHPYAGAPWNPIQAQALNCEWEGTSNNISQTEYHADQNALRVIQKNPVHFTKTVATSGLTFTQTTKVNPQHPFAAVEYKIDYEHSGNSYGPHPQEMPAIFLDLSDDTKPSDDPIDKGIARYYFYSGDLGYQDSNSSVTTALHQNGTLPLALPDRSPWTWHAATRWNAEEWVSICNSKGEKCTTLATFSKLAKVIARDNNYVTILGNFEMGLSFHQSWTVYIFPYRFDQVVQGKTIRQWIYELKQSNP